MTAENLAARLPHPDTLRAWWQSLAALDAVMSPEANSRYFTFDPRWADDEQMASMRNGSGDDASVTFRTAIRCRRPRRAVRSEPSPDASGRRRWAPHADGHGRHPVELPGGVVRGFAERLRHDVEQPGERRGRVVHVRAEAGLVVEAAQVRPVRGNRSTASRTPTWTSPTITTSPSARSTGPSSSTCTPTDHSPPTSPTVSTPTPTGTASARTSTRSATRPPRTEPEAHRRRPAFRIRRHRVSQPPELIEPRRGRRRSRRTPRAYWAGTPACASR